MHAYKSYTRHKGEWLIIVALCDYVLEQEVMQWNKKYFTQRDDDQPFNLVSGVAFVRVH